MASKNNEIPKHELQALARAFADDIIAFFESEDGQKEYEEWLQQKEKNENKAKGKAGSKIFTSQQYWWVNFSLKMKYTKMKKNSESIQRMAPKKGLTKYSACDIFIL